jgi:hypothetical protein
LPTPAEVTDARGVPAHSSWQQAAALLTREHTSQIKVSIRLPLYSSPLTQWGPNGDRPCERQFSRPPTAWRTCTANQGELTTLVPGFLGEKAFELNIIALYTMQCLGASAAELRDAVQQHASTPVPLPVKNALSFAPEPTAKKPKQLPAFAPIADEEGEREDYY